MRQWRGPADRTPTYRTPDIVSRRRAERNPGWFAASAPVPGFAPLNAGRHGTGYSARSRPGDSFDATTISNNVSSMSNVDTALTSGVTAILIME